MNIWLYLPEHLRDAPVTKAIGSTLEDLFNSIAESIPSIVDTNNPMKMEEELLIEWLKLNNIPLSTDMDVNRNLFKRYYSILRRRGTISSIRNVIETGGSIYSPGISNLYVDIHRGVDRMLKYCDKLVSTSHTKVFEPNTYCPGVFIIETNNRDVIYNNPMLDKVFPAGCKYYVAVRLIPLNIVQCIMKSCIGMTKVDRYYVTKMPGSDFGDVFSRELERFDFANMTARKDFSVSSSLENNDIVYNWFYDTIATIERELLLKMKSTYSIHDCTTDKIIYLTTDYSISNISGVVSADKLSGCRVGRTDTYSEVWSHDNNVPYGVLDEELSKDMITGEVRITRE